MIEKTDPSTGAILFKEENDSKRTNDAKLAKLIKNTDRIIILLEEINNKLDKLSK